MLPNFIIIGAQKCGTTSLLEALSAHPHVVPPKVKEPHFFDLNFHRGTSWYRRRFPFATLSTSRPVLQPGRRYMRGEATPYYLFHPLAAQRLASILPEAKLIALLRNPVDRAYSHYQHNVRRNREPLTFADAVAAEPRRLAGEADAISGDPGYSSYAHRHYSYVARGEYAGQLARFTRHFDKTSLIVLKSEDFFAATSYWVNRVFDFLDLAPLPSEQIPIQPQNVGGYDQIDVFTRAKLEQYYRPHNEYLQQIVSPELGW